MIFVKPHATNLVMSFFKYSTFFFIAFLALNSCSKNSYRFKLETTPKVSLGEKATVKLASLSDQKPDSIQLFVKDKQYALTNNIATINTTELGVGKHPVTALVFFPSKVKKLRESIEVLSNIKPEIYKAKIINQFPHDPKAYTQGLEYYNGFIYETTGRKGESWLRKVEIETGKVLQQHDLSDKYFGEGMTIFNNKIHWLTWQARKGFVFDLETFKLLNEFNYDESHEGWGLSHSKNELIKSDGSNKIWFLDPITHQEKRNIQVYALSTPINKLNEIEYINEKIYANHWNTDKKTKSTIAIINPNNGVVEGLIDLTELRNIIIKEQQLEGDDVLNGIAYDAENNRLFVTGKHWKTLFEIELIKK